jgi:aspartyl-tRNA(Asn)/glutamyl-tRNA(Gln) amidotransferase subunit A
MTQSWTIASAGRALRSGELTAIALAETCLDQISRHEPSILAFATATGDRMLADAARADRELHAGRDRGPLHGIPIAIKDLIPTRGIPTEAGSSVLAGNVPDDDAPVVQALVRAGMTLAGKTATHEFAWGVLAPPTRNPWNTDRLPGGSSSGSSAAVAAGMALGALGTDTGGSIRIPAAACGVTGFKPTYDLVNRAGVIVLSNSLDHVGPIALTVEDCALILDELVPPGSEGGFLAHIDAGIDNVHLAILGGAWEEDVEADVLNRFHEALGTFDGISERIDLPGSEITELFSDYRAIQSAEAYTYHHSMGWYPQMAERYTQVTRERLEAASHALAVDYIDALRRREEFTAAWNKLMTEKQIQICLAPTLAIGAPLVHLRDDITSASKITTTMLRLTFPFNMLGVPVLSVPCGFTSDGLPVGMQIIGRMGEDALVLRVGQAFQSRWGVPARPAELFE